MKKTVVKCPKCGTSFVIPEHEFAANGIVIGKDSGLGTIYLQAEEEGNENHSCECNSGKKHMYAVEKLNALRSKGVDVSNLFAMTGGNGGEQIARNGKNGLEIVPDNDPIFAMIIDNGWIENQKLHPRFVPSHVLAMLGARKYTSYNRTEKRYEYKSISFSEALKAKGYEYSLKVTLNMLKAMCAMSIHHDAENLALYVNWYNKDVVIAVCVHDIDTCREYINKLTTRKCKGVPYKRICGTDIFVKDIEKKIFVPLMIALGKVRSAKDLKSLYKSFREYLDARQFSLNGSKSIKVTQCKEWTNAYKGFGGYFTLRNFILFEHKTFSGTSENGSIKYLDNKALENKECGYKMLGMLKDFLMEHNISIEDQLKAWRKQSEDRRASKNA